MMNENYRKKAVNVKLIFAATAMATLALSAHSLKASAVPVDNFITPTAVQQQKTDQWKFSGDKHKSLQVDTERTFHQRYPLVML